MAGRSSAPALDDTWGSRIIGDREPIMITTETDLLDWQKRYGTDPALAQQR